MKLLCLPSFLYAALLVSSLCMAGCVQDQTGRSAVNDTLTPNPVIATPTSAPAATTAVPVPTMQGIAARTCSQLGGDLCSATEDCPGSWLDAADSFSCCSRPCMETAGAVLTIEPFEPLPAYDEQESISP